ncbi:ATP-binding protein [Nonomuraea sp. 10N515B]|uniref:ATP-binding protein n=1 Tax=Nonomuraea sp. 10N515B TaxID=3457422 RepID=UPI003FCC5D43
MGGFNGRERELAALDRDFRCVGGEDRPGRAILMRGRRCVGKTRLTEEFIRRSGVPSLFFTAPREPITCQLGRFIEDAADSDLPNASIFENVTAGSWDTALRLVAQAVPQGSPSIVVLDELPYMIARDPHLEGTLQRLFDREFSRLPMLLILIGSDQSVMEAINQDSRPFSGRASEMLINPLTPADVADKLELPPADAIDAYLITGGLPMILNKWPASATMREFLDNTVSNPVSALIVSSEHAMAETLHRTAPAWELLNTIGSGAHTYSSISEASGMSITRGLRTLMEKRMITADVPLSTRSPRQRRYRITYTDLSFWLSCIEPGMPEIYRRRGDLALRRIERSWTAWHSTALKSFVRQSLRRMDDLPERTGAIGGFWTRTNAPEIDVVGADREPLAKAITMVGSVKWLEDRPFDHHDLSELIDHRSKMPGADTSTPLYAVSRSGCSVGGVTHITPENLLGAWR